MKLGAQLGYWGSGPPADAAAVADAAEELGFDSIWTAEAYGSDAFTPLAWYGSRTRSVKLGTSIVQMSARTPAATAMAALTLDHLSGGRVMLGLGVSGPQVVEGWYGQPFAKPLARTREYISIIRQVLAREAPVTSEGPHYPLPLPGGTGLGKPLKPTVHPRRAQVPILLGAGGAKNVALAAEIADGWLPLWFSPKLDGYYRAALAEGFGRPGARHSIDDFEVAATVPMIPIDDIEVAADFLRPMLALYIGGMGAKDTNFHFDVFVRMGYEAECHEIQAHYLDGRRPDAIAAVPTALVDDVALLGSPDRLRDRLQAWEETMVTTMLVGGSADVMRVAAGLVS